MRGRRKLLGFAAAVALVVVASPVSAGTEDAIRGAAGTLWVTERTPGSSTVTAFDASTGDVLGTTSVGSVPIGITAPRGSGKAYSSDEAAGQMSVIDKKTITVDATIPMGPCPQIDGVTPPPKPHHLMASRDGRLIYVAEYGCAQVGVIDTRADARVAGFTASTDPLAKTHAVWITPDGDDLYAANEGSVSSGPGTISKLDAHTGALVWEIPIGNRPSEILVTPNGTRAYVSVRNDSVIRVVDLTGTVPTVIGQAEANNQPDTLSLTNDGRTLVVGLRASPTGRARAALIDTVTLATTYVEMPSHTTTGHQWLSANGRYAFMAVESPGGVAVIDTISGAVIDEYAYPTGGTAPHGVFHEPPTKRT